MATMFERIKQLVPVRAWFTDETPVLDSVIAGIAAGLEYVKRLLDYVKLQTRILTATDGWLDLIAADMFGPTVTRKPGQTDASFRAEILANLFLEKATRHSLKAVLEALTGNKPIIIEPQRAADTGGYSMPVCGYGVAGAYGSVSTPWQAFVTVYRPAGAGIPFVGGYGSSVAAYRTPSRSEYVQASAVLSQISDEDIYRAIDVTKPAGTLIWVRITDKPTKGVTHPTNTPLLLDGSWQLDGSYTLDGERT